jgi:nucleotide-binding universal stress UspA family protein
MKILVAVDGSKYTKRMLAYLAAHDEWLGAQHAYTLVTVVPPLPPRAAAVLPKDVLTAHYDMEAERVFKPVRQFLAKKPLAVDYVSKTGPAAETIAALSDKGKFDLLMMGSHGHGAFGNLVLGSVATKVLAQCKAPVLLVR